MQTSPTIAAVEDVVVFVAKLAAQAVFRIKADAGFKFLPFGFGHGNFHGHAVALQIIKIGLHGRAGVVAVVF